MQRRRRDEAQVELFVTPSRVERLDPKTTLGAATRVEALWRVRLGDDGTVHLVFHDRHGRYCEEHGKGCRAVRVITSNE